MINELGIRKNIESFSFPRIYGSDAEKRAYELARKKIEDLNLTATTQSFQFSRFYSIVYGRVLFVLIFWIILILYLNVGGLVQDILLVVPSVLLITLLTLSRWPEKIKFGKLYSSQNVYTKLISKEADEKIDNEKLNVFFIAHLDSKGQRLNITNRVKTYILWFFSLGTSIFFIVFKNVIFHGYPYIIIFYIFGAMGLILNFLSVLALYINRTNDCSPGALDNASGIACVLELLNHYSSNQELKNMIPWFVLTGAEECGTMGIRKFYDVIKESKLEKEKILIVNFDSIGTKIDLIKFGITWLKKDKFQDLIIERAEKKYDMKIKKRKVPIGVHTDGYFLFKKGYNGIEFGDWISYQYLHTVRDTIDKIDVTLLSKLCVLVSETLKEIDNSTQKS